ncbi:MAG: hypothetical protein H6927_03590 [Burkholderiaceae bacterium]|nr:hypothetical protein [Burkholderiaceae bacterium]MCP5217171.1 hypothetical protein [Burkholderiaceae bacterium]
MAKQLARTAAAVVMTTAMAWNLPASAQTPPSRPTTASTRGATTTPKPAAAPASAPASAPRAAQGSFGPSSPTRKPRP